MDAHDEAARALDAEIRETLPPLLRPSTPLEDGLMRQIIAAALRKAAADEREACAVICSAMSVSETSYGQPVAARQLLLVAELIRARAKGGA